MPTTPICHFKLAKKAFLLETGKLYYQAGSLHAYNWDLKARLLF